MCERASAIFISRQYFNPKLDLMIPVIRLALLSLQASSTDGADWSNSSLQKSYSISKKRETETARDIKYWRKKLTPHTIYAYHLIRVREYLALRWFCYINVENSNTWINSLRKKQVHNFDSFHVSISLTKLCCIVVQEYLFIIFNYLKNK